jgi:hypothetical protein
VLLEVSVERVLLEASVERVWLEIKAKLTLEISKYLISTDTLRRRYASHLVQPVKVYVYRFNILPVLKRIKTCTPLSGLVGNFLS